MNKMVAFNKNIKYLIKLKDALKYWFSSFYYFPVWVWIEIGTFDVMMNYLKHYNQSKKTALYCSPAGTETLICLCCDLAKDEPIWMKNVRRKNIFICIWKKNKFYKHSTASLVLKSIVLMFHYTQLENSSFLCFEFCVSVSVSN